MVKYRTYRKPYRLKKKKSIFRSRVFWLAILFLIILGGVSYLIFFSPFFQIKEIKISGNQKVLTENLKELIKEKISRKFLFFPSESIFLANLNEISEEILEKFPQIEKINFKRKFPDTLEILIEEKKPVAIFCFTPTPNTPNLVWGRDEDCFFIDREGVIFEEISGAEIKMLKIKSSSTKILELGNEVIEKEKMEKILKINSKSAIPIEEILVVSEGRFNTKTSEGWEIYFNPQRDLDWQLEELDILLKEKVLPEKRGNLQYIDLRFDKIYIYPETYSM